MYFSAELTRHPTAFRKCLRGATKQISQITFFDAYGKVAQVLLNLAEEYGRVEDGCILLSAKYSRQEMAGIRSRCIHRTHPPCDIRCDATHLLAAPGIAVVMRVEGPYLSAHLHTPTRAAQHGAGIRRSGVRRGCRAARAAPGQRPATQPGISTSLHSWR